MSMLACRPHLALVLLAGALASVATGCGGATRGDDRQASGIMTVLGLEYGDYLATHQNVPPKDEAAFRAFVASRPQKMAEYRVSNVDELFMSPRDGQPIQIVCGVAKPVLDSVGYAVAACETAGIDGQRLVANVRGGVSELSAADFAQAFPTLAQ